MVGAVVVLVALVGCGSKSNDSGGGVSSSSYLKTVKGEVNNLLRPKGTFVKEPTSSPSTPPGQKKIAFISCGQQVTACSTAWEAAQQAAELRGWKITLFDAKLDYPSASQGVRQAVAQGADGIISFFVDCQYFKAGLEDAKKAGVPVVAAESRDCNETSPGAPSLFSYVIHYGHGETYEQQSAAFARASAQYAVDKFNGQSHALALMDDTPSIDPLVTAIQQIYAKCAGCTLNMVRIPVSAYGSRLQGIAEQELAKDPQVNTLLNPYEATALEDYPAVRSSGRESKILTFMGEGGEAGLDLIRQGANGFAFAWPVPWDGGWAPIDALGRIFAGEKPVATGQGHQLIDATHNLPKTGASQSPVDFEAMYTKAWGG